MHTGLNRAYRQNNCGVSAIGLREVITVRLMYTKTLLRPFVIEIKSWGDDNDDDDDEHVFYLQKRLQCS